MKEHTIQLDFLVELHTCNVKRPQQFPSMGKFGGKDVVRRVYVRVMPQKTLNRIIYCMWQHVHVRKCHMIQKSERKMLPVIF